MSEDVETLLLVIGMFILFLGGSALLAKGLERLTWVRAGRPTLSKRESLQFSLLRYNGLTTTAALFQVLGQRNSGHRETIEQIRDFDDLLHNPEREEERAKALPAMSASILARDNGDALKQMYVETMLQQSKLEKAQLLYRAMQIPDQRAKVMEIYMDLAGLRTGAVDAAARAKAEEVSARMARLILG